LPHTLTSSRALRLTDRVAVTSVRHPVGTHGDLPLASSIDTKAADDGCTSSADQFPVWIAIEWIGERVPANTSRIAFQNALGDALSGAS
jgi:hypothetical protein